MFMLARRHPRQLQTDMKTLGGECYKWECWSSIITTTHGENLSQQTVGYGTVGGKEYYPNEH